MEGGRFKKRNSDRLVEESMRLARRFSRRPADPVLHMVAMGLLGFAFSLLLTARHR